MKEPLFETQLHHLVKQLALPLPGKQAQAKMAPAFREERLALALKQNANPRHSAVMVLLFPKDAMLHVLLTVRQPTLKHHAGQVSFPGGRLEENEHPETAALREAEEEVGVAIHDIQLLGKMTSLYIPPSNFWVEPFVGFIPYQPVWQLQAKEVSEALEVPLTMLLNPEIATSELWHFNGVPRNIPFYVIEHHKVWGATAMMLAELLALFTDFDK